MNNFIVTSIQKISGTLLIITLFFWVSCDSSENSITYTTLNYPAVAGTSTLITGVRGVDNSSDVYISGFYTTPGAQDIGFLYKGPILGGGTWQALTYPSSSGITVTGTSLYGPNNGAGSGQVQIVGNYTTSENGAGAIGLLYQGPTDGSGTWTTLNPQALETRPIKNTIAHSTMGGFVVGNYDTDLVTGKAFIYDIANNSYLELTKPGAVSITAYGIWHNGGTRYTIAGGYSDTNEGGVSIAYLVDWDSSSQATSNWTSYTYKNQTSVITHFEGITTDTHGGYNLVADWVSTTQSSGAAFVNIPRTKLNTFGSATWTDIAYPGATLTSGNTVYLNDALGIYRVGSDVSNGYVAMIPYL